MVSEREGRSPVIGLLSHNAPSLRARLQFDMFGLCNYDMDEQEDILYANALRYMDMYKDEYMD